MDRENDLFERMSDGSVKWRGFARSIEKAHLRAKHIFQIAYDEGLLVTRAAILRSRGYEVTSVVGNGAAKAVLSALPRHDLFIIGHAAPEQTRLAMVYWLRTNYPKTKILALNPLGCEQLDQLDYNATYNAPDTWLPVVAAAVG